MTELDAIKNAQRLYHIIQAIARIRRSVEGITKEEFFANEDKQGNVVRCIEIIGEAANHISAEIRGSCKTPHFFLATERQRSKGKSMPCESQPQRFG